MCMCVVNCVMVCVCDVCNALCTYDITCDVCGCCVWYVLAVMYDVVYVCHAVCCVCCYVYE